jgi:hypothetical protein
MVLLIASPAWAFVPPLYGPDGSSCFPISHSAAASLVDARWVDGVQVVVEEESICRDGQKPLAAWRVRPHGWQEPDDPDMDLVLAAVAEHDPKVAAAFRAHHERTKTGITAAPYTAADVEDVLRQLAARVAAEAPRAPPVVVERTGDLIRVTASRHPILDSRVTVDAGSCPMVRRFPEGTVRDDVRCAFEGIPGMGIPPNPNLAGGSWTGNPNDNPGVWRDTPLWQVLQQFHQRHGHGAQGYVVMIEDRQPEPEAPAHLQMRKVPTVYALDWTSYH